MIGLISGILYYFFLSEDIKISIADTLVDYNFRYNSIIKDLIIMSFLLVTSIFLIGIPFSLFYLFYEGISLGFMLAIFVANFKISGLFYVLFYIFINKLLLLFIMAFFVKKMINVGRLVIGMFIYYRDSVVKNKLLLNLKNGLYLIVIVFVFNFVLYFITPSIFNYLSFLIK